MIKYFIMDVDGTLTDGKIYMAASGELCKSFSIKDGYGIHDMLIPSGITPIIITGRTSEIVLNRCKELEIKEVYQGVSNKAEKLREITEDMSCVAYIGDELNDLLCMTEVKKGGGLIGCPKDAVTKVKEICDFISIHNGGDGAVRDFIDWLLNDHPILKSDKWLYRKN